MPPSSVFRRQSLTLAMLASALAATVPVHSAADPLAEIQEMHKAGRTGDAMRRLDTLITQRPTDPRPRFQKGVMLVEQKRPNEAIAVFQKLVQDYPALPEPLNNLAVLYAEQGQMEKARTTLESAIRSKPNYGTAFQNLGDLYTRMAGRAYARALQIDDTESAPKLALIRNLYEAPELGASDTLMVAAAASAVAAQRPPLADSPSPAKAITSPAAASTAGARRPEPKAQRPAAAPPAAAAHADEVRDVNVALKAWAAAWSRRDVGDYVAAYVPGFKGGDRSADEWQAARRQRILGKSSITVDLSNVKVNLSADGAAKVSFRQTYVADQLKVSSTKTVEMVKQRGKWLIRKESVGAA